MAVDTSKTNTTGNSPHLIRNIAYNATMLANFDEDNFEILNFAEFIDDLDGLSTELHIPGCGSVEITPYTEGDTIDTKKIETSLFVFKPDQELAGGISYTDKLLRDAYYMKNVISVAGEKQALACKQYIEKYFFELSATLPLAVNGVKHRINGSGTNGKLSMADFAIAKTILADSAKLYTSQVAFINQEQATEIEMSIPVVSAPNSLWEKVASEGLMAATGMRLLMNIYGVDVYVSNFLAKGRLKSDGTYDVNTPNDKIAVIVFSATAGKLPFIGAWIERPHFTVERFENRKTTEHYVHMAFGGKLIYPENLVVIECTAPTIVPKAA